jgi:hypothetical protein
MYIRTLLAAAAATALVAPSFAQDAPHQKQAREIYAKVIGFRTAEGQKQVPAMATYLADTLKAGGVPAADIVTIPNGETVAMIVRVPGSNAAAKPILFNAYGYRRCAAGGLEPRSVHSGRGRRPFLGARHAGQQGRGDRNGLHHIAAEGGQGAAEADPGVRLCR